MNGENTKDSGRAGGLLAWQWALHAAGHTDRRNLAIHALTVPLFWLGCGALGVSPWVSVWLAPAGLVAAVGAVAAQGRGHAREATRPVPFRGPLDALVRLAAEQWITFPRFVLSGKMGAAARTAREEAANEGPSR